MYQPTYSAPISCLITYVVAFLMLLAFFKYARVIRPFDLFTLDYLILM